MNKETRLVRKITGWAFSYNEPIGHYFNNSIKSLCGRLVPIAYSIETSVTKEECCKVCVIKKAKITNRG
ncbi:MAG TPA: hypothetical protein PLP33_14780 [Leptospiraceae bacterium]|nr:hypothetical protein [Leptospiraceae bacterium]